MDRETLGSYLHRLADANHITITAISQLLGTSRRYRRSDDDPTTWTTKSEVKVSGVDKARASVTLSLALDSNGAPGIAWFADDLNLSYNEVLLFWKPAGGGAPVKVMDSQGVQNDQLAVKLVFAGLNPRVLTELQRTDSDFGPQCASTGKTLCGRSRRSCRRKAASTRAGSFLLATATRTPASASDCNSCW